MVHRPLTIIFKFLIMTLNPVQDVRQGGPAHDEPAGVFSESRRDPRARRCPSPASPRPRPRLAPAHVPLIPLATSRDRHGPDPFAADACRDGRGSPRSGDSDAVSAPRLAATRIGPCPCDPQAAGAVTARDDTWSRRGHGVIDAWSRRGHGR